MAARYPEVQHSSLVLSGAEGPTLAYALFLPSPHPSKLALIAHPLGRLGGRKEDPVVVGLARALLKEGWAVLTYDSRGAGQSTGSASFSGIPEAEDYRQMLIRVLMPLRAPDAPCHLLLCGYSAGSLSACCPPPALPNIASTRYVLVSYPVSVLWALTLFRPSPFESALKELVEEGRPVLAVYGDSDQFSGVDKLRAWAAGLKAMGDSFQSVEVGGADHFWREEGAMEQLCEAVVKWSRVPTVNAERL